MAVDVEILEIESLLGQMLQEIQALDICVPESELTAIRRKLADVLKDLRRWDEYDWSLGT